MLAPVLLVIHIMIAAALVAIVLVQRSEGGALGMGGGGFMSGRGQANFLTRTTAYLAMAFFATSIALTLLANRTATPRSAFDPPAPAQPAPAPSGSETPAAPAPAAPAPARGGILDKLQGGTPPK
jgi:preprotein translocase subunit SecG